MSTRHARRFPVIMTLAFVLAEFSSTCRADELGRLFTTPELRNLLDKMRYSLPDKNSQALSVADTDIAGQDTGSKDINVQGFVYRKHGRSTVWINGAILRATDASGVVDTLFDIAEGAADIEVHQKKTVHQPMTE